MPSRRKPPIGARLRQSAVGPIALGMALGVALASDPPRSFGELTGPLRPGPGRLVGIPYAPEGASLSGAQRRALWAENIRLSPGVGVDEERQSPEILRRRAILALTKGNPDDAVQLLELALERLPANPVPSQEAILRSDLSAAHLQRFAQGDSPISSLAALDEAARAVELAPGTVAAAENLSEISRRLGLAGSAPKTKASTLADAVRHGDRIALGEVPVPDALEEGVRRYREGLEFRRRLALEFAAMAFADASRHLSDVGSPFAPWAEFRRAEVDYQAGNYSEALARLAPLATETDSLLAGRSAWLTGTIHTQEGDLSAAAKDYGRAQELLKPPGEPEYSYGVLDLVAENLRLRDLARSAWSRHLAALAGLQFVSDPAKRRQILSGAGTTAAARARFWAARLLETASYEAVEAGGAGVSPATRAHASRLRADLALQSGDLKTAREAWDEAEKRLEAIPDAGIRGPIEGDLLLLGARIVFAAGGEADSTTLTRALERLSVERANEGFRALPQRRIELWGEEARWLALAGRLEDSSRVLGRAEVLAETLKVQLSAKRTLGLRAAYADLAAARLRAGDSTRAFEALVRAQCWRAGEVARCVGQTFDRWARSLPTRVLAVMAWPMDSQLALFAARRGQAPVGRLVSIGRGELTRLAERFRENPNDLLLGRRLSRLLLTPIEGLLYPDDRLFASLEGVLGTLPVAALPTASGHYLAEEHDLALARRIAAIPEAAASWPSETSRWRPLIVGVAEAGDGFKPLPEAEEEARGVEREFPGGEIFLAEAIRKAPILEALSEANLFHFAGHASLRRGGLILGEQEGEKIDVLSAEDLSPRVANLRLAVLSACRTGRTEGLDAELDLSRALLDAGVPAVLATTALVDDDKTLALFARFYPQLKASGDPLRALRAAQIAMLRSGDSELRSPEAWGSFVVWVYRELI